MTLSAAFLAELQSILPADSFSLQEGVLEGYARDESSQPAQRPLAVFWPQSTEEVAALVALCHRHRVPVTARGGGSSLEGNSIPTPDGVVLSLEKMNRVLEILPQDFQARVQPGVVYDDLNRQLAPYSLFFAPAPSSGDVATIGGMIGNNAGGMNALRYGVTRHHVLRLQVVLADGSVVWFGTRAFKTSAGFDLVQLMIGSEGMLGIVTEIVLRLQALPERRVATALFPNLELAARAAYEVINSGIIPGALELMDERSVAHINRYKGWSWPEKPVLIFEFHGTPAGVQEENEVTRQICADLGAVRYHYAETQELRLQLQQGRREITNAEKALYPDYITIKGDVAVPLSQFVPTVRYAEGLGEKYGLLTTLFGHAGDGNVHWHTLVPPNDAQALEKGEKAAEELIRFAISVGGTASAEHGIGLAKRRFLVEEHGAAVEVMKKIKQALDPNNILNPDKMFP